MKNFPPGNWMLHPWRFCPFLILMSPCLGKAQETDAGKLDFFENKIRPILVEHCYECHSGDQDEAMGGLLLDSRTGWQRGGDSGVAIEVGDPHKSLLIHALKYSDRDLQMPPESKLPDAVIRDFKSWIREGAIDPRDGELSQSGFDLQARRDSHWSWQPVRAADRGESIDYWIQRKLDEKQMHASQEAQPALLLRRLKFSLHGLPPTPQELQRFLREHQIDPDRAWESTVDRLLASPRLGEHWATMWLDLVRYSETKGHVTDQERPFAWKYRDYVIDAFNDDVPYDQFVVEHLAGDLLSDTTTYPARIQRGTLRSATATGSLFMHEMHFMSVDPVKQRWDEINAQVDVAGKAFLGITTECARCHDHKFDAISQADYYALAGFFLSTEQGTKRVAPRRAELDDESKSELKKQETAYQNFLEQKRKGRRAAQSPKTNQEYFPISDELGIQAPGDTQKLFAMMGKLSEVDPSWPAWVRSAQDATTQNANLLIRGEVGKPGEVIPRRFLEALGSKPLPNPGESSGRLWLAEQFVAPDNPLTERVWANRIWQQLFGSGLVPTPSNFGQLGTPPSHPELLDYLARRLRQNDYSTKLLIREVLMSDAFRRSSVASFPAIERDPENQLLSHYSKRRMTAEQIRDSLVLTAGRLDSQMAGSSVDCFVPSYATANKPSNIPNSGPLDGKGRRSVYLKVRRNFYDPFLKKFDFPDRGKSNGQRNVTQDPGQALAMLNSPLVLELAKHWAVSLAECEAASSFEETLHNLWLSSLSRGPTVAETEVIQLLLHDLSTSQKSLEHKWMHLAHLIWNHPEFIWIE